MSEYDEGKIAHRLTELGLLWADAEAGASLLEETRKSVRAQIANEALATAGSLGKAELAAEASQTYIDHVKAMVAARREANIAKVNYDAGKIWVDLTRTRESSRRAEMMMR